MHLSWLDPHKMRRMTVVGTEKKVVFDDMEPSGRSRCTRRRPQRIETRRVADLPGDVYTRSGTDEPLRLECAHFLALVRGEGDRRKARATGRWSSARSRSSQDVARGRLDSRDPPERVVHPGTVLGEGVQVLEYAVVGKQPTLSPRSTARREPLPPAAIGDGDDGLDRARSCSPGRRSAPA